MKYYFVNRATGHQVFVEMDPSDVEESKWFWNKLGWDIFNEKYGELNK